MEKINEALVSIGLCRIISKLNEPRAALNMWIIMYKLNEALGFSHSVWNTIEVAWAPDGLHPVDINMIWIRH